MRSKSPGKVLQRVTLSMEQINPAAICTETIIKGREKGLVTTSDLELGQIGVEREIGVESSHNLDRPAVVR